MGLDVLQLLSKLPHFTYFASNARHLMRYANLTTFSKTSSTLTQKWNFFLQITTFFWKSQLFNYRNYFLQTASFSHKSQLFSINRNYFLQIATIFYKAQLFSRNPNYFLQLCNFFLQLCNFFLRVTTIFYNLKTFFYNISTVFYKYCNLILQRYCNSVIRTKIKWNPRLGTLNKKTEPKRKRRWNKPTA